MKKEIIDFFHALCNYKVMKKVDNPLIYQKKKSVKNVISGFFFYFSYLY